jgi:Ca2+-binding EF-hand superfamily protein
MTGRRVPATKRLRIESLEARLPLHGGPAYFQNPLLSTDVNLDGSTNIDDILTIIEEYRAVRADAGHGGAYDVNADTLLNISDILSIVHHCRPATPPPPAATATVEANTPVVNGALLSLASIRSPEDVFDHLDTDSSGQLSLDEFKAPAELVHATNAATAIFDRLDTNDNQSLTLDEFLKVLPPRPHLPTLPPLPHLPPLPQLPNIPTPTYWLQAAFNRIDTNDDTYITLNEVTPLARLVHAESRASELFAQLDANHDQRLSFDEFKEIITLWRNGGTTTPPSTNPPPTTPPTNPLQARIESLFDHLDTDGSGELSLDEFLVPARRYNATYLAEMVFNRLDDDHNHSLSLDEILETIPSALLAVPGMQQTA